MPNWCDNHLTIHSKDPQLLANIAKAAEKNELLAFLRPEPDYETTPVAKTFHRKEGDEIPTIRPDSWWDWRVQNWGTKWDIDTDPDNVFLDLKEGVVSIGFCTAWSPPCDALNYAAEEHGFDFELYYYEPGMCFCGYATPFQDDHYNIPEKSKDIEAEIPDHILKMFSIMETALEYEEGE